MSHAKDSSNLHRGFKDSPLLRIPDERHGTPLILSERFENRMNLPHASHDAIHSDTPNYAVGFLLIIDLTSSIACSSWTWNSLCFFPSLVFTVSTNLLLQFGSFCLNDSETSS